MRNKVPGLMIALAGAWFAASPARAADCIAIPAADLIKSGTLTMSTNPTLPPLQYVNASGELVGMRIDLGHDIAKRLCLTPDFIKIDFDAMVPGLQGGRWDMIDTGIFFTPARAKIMQLIPYESQAISISVPNGAAGDAIHAPADLEGKTVGVEIGGFEEGKTKALDAELKAKGGKGLTVRTFDSFALAYQALRAGQVDAVTSIDSVAKEYADRGDFKRAILGLYPTPVALAFKSKPLAEAALAAMKAMQADGSYDKLFKQYGVVPIEDLKIEGPAG